ncbi:MAG: hypothetical protein NT010_14680 [Proteobacteria bacterium]|nr:hypothetical protein [Pseudomonadota bacterium]
MIHCIGDSHVMIFTGIDEVKENNDSLTFFRTHWIGPRTAFNIIDKTDIISRIVEGNLQEGDSILFCFGEIDCRAHLLKQAEMQNKPLTDIVHNCVSRYVKIFEFAKRYGHRIIALSVPPSGFGDWDYGEFPTYGSCHQRLEATKLFNRSLEEYCENNDVYFVSIFEKLLDNNGMPDPIYYIDNIHLSQRVMPFIIDELCKLSLLKDEYLLSYKKTYLPYSACISQGDFELKLRSPKFSGFIRPDFLKEIQLISGAEYFIESGTYLGHTSDVASLIYKEVYTIELSKDLYSAAVKRFEGRPNIHIYQGDSAHIFPKMLPQIRGKAVFWLDAHYSKGATEKSSNNTPIIEELQTIKDSSIRDAVILIDDVINFQKISKNSVEYSSLTGYPTINEVCSLIKDIQEEYKFAVLGNALMAYPGKLNILLSPVLQSCTISRLFNGDNLDVNDVTGAEEIISQAEGVELSAIRELRENSLDMENYGLGGHYRLWYALTLYKEKRFDDACNELAITMRLDCDHWRVKWYMACAAYEGDNYLLAEKSLCSVLSESPQFPEALSLFELLKQKHEQHPLSNHISPQSHLALANQYQNEGKYVEALHEIENAVNKGIDNNDVRYQYAQLLIATRQLEKAEIELKELVTKNIKHTFAYNDLGVISSYKGDHNGAVQYFKIALSASNVNYGALKNLLSLLIKQQNYHEAIEITQLLMKNMPEDKELRIVVKEFNLPILLQ